MLLLKIAIFWLVFLLPGWTLFSFLNARYVIFKKSELYLSKIIIYAFFLSIFLFSPIAILAYLFEIKFIFTEIYFLLLIAISFVWQVKTHTYQQTIKNIKQSKRKVLSIHFIVGTVLLTADYVFTSITNSFLVFGGDLWVHIAKINQSIEQGFSTSDPFFHDSNQVIIQANHPSNIFHVILALASGTLHIPVPDLWAQSGAFFRLISFLVVYVFVRELTKNKNIAFIACILLFISQMQSETWLTILYPASLAFFATIFCIIIVMKIINSTVQLRMLYGIYMASILIVALAHQLQYCLMILFLSGFYLYLLNTKKINLSKFKNLSYPLIIGIPLVFFSLYALLHIPDFSLSLGSNIHYFASGLYALKLPNFLGPATLLILGGVILISRYTKNFQRNFVVYTIVFSVLLLYTPLFTVVNWLIPSWGIERFTYLSKLILVILCSFAIYFIFEYIKKIQSTKRLVYIGLVVVLVPVVTIPYQVQASRLSRQVSKSKHDFSEINQLKLLAQNIESGSVIMADLDTSYVMPGLCNCSVVGIDFRHTTNYINAKPRENDVDEFFDRNTEHYQRSSILKKYNVSYMILSSKSSVEIKPDEYSYKFIAQSGSYELYKL